MGVVKMASPTTNTSNKAVKVRYYPIVVESKESYDKETSDEFYLVIHNEATDVLIDIIVNSVTREISEALAKDIEELCAIERSEHDNNSKLVGTVEKKIDEWRATKFVDNSNAGKQLKAEFVKKIAQDKAKLKGNAKYGGQMQSLKASAEKPKRDELLVYDPVEIFGKIVDSDGKTRTLQQMIDILTSSGDLYKFLMEIGHMAG